MLFTTETFSMGINMPAKTVVFTSIEKFDGDEYRWVSGGEFIQMSGRAGRRGLDDKGVTIMIATKKLEPDVAKQILKGKSDPLYSTFHLGYNMLLNMMRIEDIHPEDIILKSFHQFQNERELPQLKHKLEESLAELKTIKIDGEDRLEKLAKLKDQKVKVDTAINQIVCLPENIVPFLVPGRFIKITDNNEALNWGWGVVVSFQKQRINPKKFIMGDSKNKDYLDVIAKTEVHYILDVLLYVKNKLTSENVLQPGDFSKKDGRLGVIPVLLHPDSISVISTIQMNLPGHNLTSAESLKQVEMLYGEIMKRFNQGDALPVLDPKEDMEIEDSQLDELLDTKLKINKELDKINAKALITEAQQTLYQRKQELRDTVRDLEEAVKKSSEMIMKNDLVNMKRVMRRLDMCDKNDVPSLKGKVASRISAADELVRTELLFSGIFQDIEPYQIAALCSCLVYTDAKSEGKITKDDKLAQPFLKLQ